MITNDLRGHKSSTPNESLALESLVPIQQRDHSTNRSWTALSTSYFLQASLFAPACSNTTDHVFNTALNTGLITPLITPKRQQITGDHARTHRFLFFPDQALSPVRTLAAPRRALGVISKSFHLFQIVSGSLSDFFTIFQDRYRILSCCFRLFQAIAKFFSAGWTTPLIRVHWCSFVVQFDLRNSDSTLIPSPSFRLTIDFPSIFLPPSSPEFPPKFVPIREISVTSSLCIP